MSDAPVLFSRADGVARIVLNRPDKLNAFTAPLHAALRDALDQIEADETCRCLVITGAGRAFCAGQDLSERIVPPGAPPIDLGETVGRDANPLIRRLTALPFPVIAAVNGFAAGLGASTALAADIVLAARSAKFVFSFTRVGLGPDGGGSWIVPRLVGQARAAALMLAAEPVTAEQAEAWGLIWKCLDDDALAPEADRLARHMASQPALALAATKRALRASWANGLDEQLEVERENQRRLGATDDYREGIAAFMEKRPAKFTGR